MAHTVRDEIMRLKKELNVTIAAHFYQKDDVVEIADITGDSLELSKKAMNDPKEFLIFCGVGFMGQSVKILSPSKRVLMPKIACCSMAKMISSEYFDASVAFCESHGIAKESILPVTYINSNADVKAKVGEMGGMVCTSSNAHIIISHALKSGQKILFVPDKCLGQNIAVKMGLKACVIGDGSDPKEADIICYDGFCSVHQLFEPKDVEFYRQKYPGIVIATHPECRPDVVAISDFVGSTSQLIAYVNSLSPDQKVAVGTEFNLVNRMRKTNTYVLSSTKPECPTMNETSLEDVLAVLKSIERKSPINEIMVDDTVSHWAKVSLDRMMALC